MQRQGHFNVLDIVLAQRENALNSCSLRHRGSSTATTERFHLEVFSDGRTALSCDRTAAGNVTIGIQITAVVHNNGAAACHCDVTIGQIGGTCRYAAGTGTMLGRNHQITRDGQGLACTHRQGTVSLRLCEGANFDTDRICRVRRISIVKGDQQRYTTGDRYVRIQGTVVCRDQGLAHTFLSLRDRIIHIAKQILLTNTEVQFGAGISKNSPDLHRIDRRNISIGILHGQDAVVFFIDPAQEFTAAGRSCLQFCTGFCHVNERLIGHSASRSCNAALGRGKEHLDLATALNFLHRDLAHSKGCSGIAGQQAAALCGNRKGRRTTGFQCDRVYTGQGTQRGSRAIGGHIIERNLQLLTGQIVDRNVIDRSLTAGQAGRCREGNGCLTASRSRRAALFADQLTGRIISRKRDIREAFLCHRIHAHRLCIRIQRHQEAVQGEDDRFLQQCFSLRQREGQCLLDEQRNLIPGLQVHAGIKLDCSCGCLFSSQLGRAQVVFQDPLGFRQDLFIQGGCFLGRIIDDDVFGHRLLRNRLHRLCCDDGFSFHDRLRLDHGFGLRRFRLDDGFGLDCRFCRDYSFGLHRRRCCHRLRLSDRLHIQINFCCQ